MNKTFKNKEIWFVTGSQHLYGEQTLKQVASDSQAIVNAFNESDSIPVKTVFQPVVTTPDSIYNLCLEANNTKECIGLITWMHTFSPAKMWISGIKILQKPIAHLHTQFNRDIPWNEIDMDFMNLNQSAHGGREYGFILSRMGINRKVIVGFWKEKKIQKQLADWIRVAVGWNEMNTMKIVRFGDNMREVAVTEGDKVEAQIKLGCAVYGYGVGDLADSVNGVSEKAINSLLEEYESEYTINKELLKGGPKRPSVIEAARIELGIKQFLVDGGFKAFTTTFEDLHGLVQLPGLAVQRLMKQGYGFGAEGDWKTSAMVRAVKAMTEGLDRGTSFMEDYTYHFDPSGMKVLGAHMLEICESIAEGKPSLDVFPLGIGGKSDPARLLFDVPSGPAINVSIMDMGNRFRLLTNEVTVVPTPQDLPKLPVARVLWEPKPDLEIAAAAWIYAGGAHHTVFSQAATAEMIQDFSEMAGIEHLVIDEKTNIIDFKNTIRWNDVYYHTQPR
ncbi:MAG: L-arabinose isomerase [Bacteroidales bacterium]|nr:L-arabinose isomerase [Bacteroidales bacterium]